MKRNYLSLWGILAVSFVAVLALSIYGDEVQLGSFSIKTSRLHSTLFAEPEQAAPLLAAAEPVAVSVEPIKVEAQVDTAKKVVLFAGDSMVECLNPRMAAYCLANGHTLYSVVWYSSTTEIWSRSKLLSRYIQRYHPDYIFISLGGNELFVNNIAAKRDKYVKSILQEVGDVPFVWIGPPNWKADTGINDLIAANTAKGNFFMSNGMKFERKKDGAHPTAASSVVWMDSIASWMPKSAHPILMDKPDNIRVGRPKKLHVHQPGANP